MARIIDADEFMKNFDKEIENGATDVFDAVENALEETPTIEAEPVKHGKWEFYDFTSPIMFCSECKALAGWDSCGDYQSVMSAYCPNCGARMDGAIDED